MNSKKKTKLLIFLLAVCCSVFIGYNYIMNPPKSIEQKTVDFTGSASEFITKVSTSPLEWTDKVVIIEGETTSKDALGIKLNGNIYCQFKEGENFANIKKNQKIKLKGRVIGYDDLLEEVKLDQCIIK